MEQENQNVTPVAENTATPAAEPKKEEKTFTQEEVNQIVQDRLKKMPNKEELDKFHKWQESQKTTDEKITELTQSNSQKDEEIASKDQVISIMQKGITDKDDVEFIQFKVAKMEGGFTEENLDKYLKDNDRFSKKSDEKKQTGFSQTNSNKPVNENKAYLDKKYANNPYYKK